MSGWLAFAVAAGADHTRLMAALETARYRVMPDGRLAKWYLNIRWNESTEDRQAIRRVLRTALINQGAPGDVVFADE
jgi:hypothetical protein